jgi:WD40 repeat protein
VNSLGGIYLYASTDFKAEPQQLTPASDIYSIEFSPIDPNILYTLNPQGIDIWDISTGEITSSIELKEATYGRMRMTGITRDDQAISFDLGYTLKLADGSMTATPLGENLKAFVISHNGELSAATIFDGTIASKPILHVMGADGDREFELYEGDIVDVFPGDLDIVDIAFSLDDSQVAVLSASGSVREWDLATGDRVAFIRGEGVSASTNASAVVYHPDGKTLATAESEPKGVIRVFETAGMKPVADFGTFTGDTTVRDLAYNPDGSLLAIVVDSTVRILQTTDYTETAAVVLKY